MMIGAIIGDIVGSVYEFKNVKRKEFLWFAPGSHATDDTVMTIAIAKALLDSKEDYSDLSEKAIYWMRYFGRKNPNAGYGGMFLDWLHSEENMPYNSYGNGAAMRISAVGWFGKTLQQVKELSKKVTEVTHNHIEGIKGAEAVAVCIFLSREGKSKGEIKSYIEKEYYNLSFKLDEIRKDYSFDETCQGSVPQAIRAFLESKNFIDAIQNAISIGGDSDTIAAITGSIAEAYYFFPEINAKIIDKALSFLDKEQKQIIIDFNKTSRIDRSLLI
jgi:type I restriction enzyme M protein